MMSFVCLWSPSWWTAAAYAEPRGEERDAERALHNPTLQDDYGSQKGKATRAAWQDRKRRRGAPSADGEREAESGNRGITSRAAARTRGAPPEPHDRAPGRTAHHPFPAPRAGFTRVAPDDAPITDTSSRDAAFAELLPALLACTPRVSVGTGGCVWADARGLDGAATAQRLLDAAHRHGFTDVHAGVASTVVAAELAATRCDAPLLVVRPGTDRAFVAPFVIAVLSPSTLTAALLDGIGVTTCGELAALDGASVEVRLGAEGERLWRLARADDPRLVFTAPARPLPSAAVEWVEYALRDPERLQFVIHSLLGTVCDALGSQGERAREITLDFALAGRTRFVHTMRASRPTASQSGWMRLVRTTLERLRLPDAVVGVELRVDRVAENDAAQGDLFDRGFASAPAVESALAQIADDQSDVVATPRNSAHPLVDARTEWVAHAPSSVVEGGGEDARLRKTAAAASTSDPQLTLQLVTPPRPVRVTTQRRRDHRVPVRYRDGRWWTLTDVAGPDRVSGGQWDAPYAREYFRCVREDGVMVWLFRGDRGRGTGDGRSALGGPGTADQGPEIGSHSLASSGTTRQWFLQGWWD